MREITVEEVRAMHDRLANGLYFQHGRKAGLQRLRMTIDAALRKASLVLLSAAYLMELDRRQRGDMEAEFPSSPSAESFGRELAGSENNQHVLIFKYGELLLSPDSSEDAEMLVDREVKPCKVVNLSPIKVPIR